LNQNEACEQCVEGGNCINGILYNQAGIFLFKNILFEFGKKKGFWKADILTKNIYSCTPYPGSCLLGDDDIYKICDTGYIGPLCQTCDHGFAKYGSNQCRPCLSQERNYFEIFGIAVGFTILLCLYIKSLFVIYIEQIYLIRLNFNNSMHFLDKSFAIKKMILGAYIKIFVNYSQTIAIVTTLHLNWDQILSDVFNIHKTASGGVQQVVAIECLVEGLIINLLDFN